MADYLASRLAEQSVAQMDVSKVGKKAVPTVLRMAVQKAARLAGWLAG